MPRLVIVSNRVSLPRKGTQAGGLAVALRDALERHGGLWFGWSGEVSEGPQVPPPRTVSHGGITTITKITSPLTAVHHYSTGTAKTIKVYCYNSSGSQIGYMQQNIIP